MINKLQQQAKEEFDRSFSEMVDVPDDLYKYGGTINTREERIYKLNAKEVLDFQDQQISKAYKAGGEEERERIRKEIKSKQDYTIRSFKDLIGKGNKERNEMFNEIIDEIIKEI